MNQATLGGADAARPALLRAAYATVVLLAVAAALLALVTRDARPVSAPSTLTSTSTPSAPGQGVTVVGVPVTEVSQAPPLGHNEQGAVGQIPWSGVGPGWSLALWQAVPSWRESGPQTLFLVDPVGGRYLVSTSVPSGARIVGWAAPTRIALVLVGATQQLSAFNLANGATLWQEQLPADGVWSVSAISGDGQRALIWCEPFGSADSPLTSSVEEITLATGAVLHTLSFPGYSPASYTLPQGLALVVDDDGVLRRVAPDGTTELTFPTSFPTVGAYAGGDLSTPDGGELVMGASAGLAVVSNSGALVEALPVPLAATGSSDPGCQPTQWWTEGVVLASCSAAAGTSFWLVPLSAAAPTLLAASSAGVFAAGGPVWHVGDAVFAEGGVCATTWVDQLGNDGAFRQVDIPGVVPSERVVGTTASQLEVLGVSATCGDGLGSTPPAGELVFYSPSSATSTLLLGPSVNGGSVLDATAYPAPQP